MFDDERASEKEINLFFFVTSMSGLSGFRDNETGDARANVQSPHLRLFISRNYWVSSHISNFGTVGQSDPEIRRLGARAHVQRCPTPLMTCGKHLLSRVWNGLDQSAEFLIQSSPGGFGLDWIRNLYELIGFWIGLDR